MHTYTDLLVKSIKTNVSTKLPDFLLSYIAKFAVPCGSDVRLAWRDDEEQFT